MSRIDGIVRRARALGAEFSLTGDRVTVSAPTPLPSNLMRTLRQRKSDVLAYLRENDFEPWALREWRRLSLPEWKAILATAVETNDWRREDYARWMLREVLLDPTYQEPTQ